jgi:hypothetical protein
MKLRGITVEALGGKAFAFSTPYEKPPPQSLPPYLVRADPVCYTRAQDYWKQGACGVLHAGKRGGVSGGKPGRNTRLNVVEA